MVLHLLWESMSPPSYKKSNSDKELLFFYLLISNNVKKNKEFYSLFYNLYIYLYQSFVFIVSDFHKGALGEVELSPFGKGASISNSNNY